MDENFEIDLFLDMLNRFEAYYEYAKDCVEPIPVRSTLAH